MSPADGSPRVGEDRRGGRTIDDVFPQDGDVFVAVAAGVLVVESQSVQQLVLDDAILDAAELLQGHRLLLANASHR